MDTRTIFFIGKPGCGKGTQAKLLSEKTGWTVFASGKLFRELAQEDTPVGLKALFTLPTEGLSVIFDGFNRKVPEAELVIDSLKWLGRPFTILDIQVSDEEVRRRLALRKGIEGRADDSAVDERLEEYREYTEPAIELFRKAGTLIEINGEQSPEAIAVEINVALHI